MRPPLRTLISAALLALLPLTGHAQSGITLQPLWRIEGTPLGTERALDPYLALTPNRLFVAGSIEIDRDRRQVIQVFDGQTGAYLQTIEDPTGAVFAGHGDTIAANERFMVTSTYRGRSSGPGAVQVFDAETGKHLRTIDNPRARDSSFFGQLPVALSGNKIAAGVALSDDNQSTTWIFDAGTGETVLTLNEPDNEGGFLSKAERTIFGFSKALRPAHILISARQKSADDLRNVGAVFLFDAVSGELKRTFRPDVPKADTYFGTDIALTEDAAIIARSRDAGPLNWPSTEIQAFDLETGALKYALQDPDVPQTNEEVVAGNQGSDFGFSFVIMDDLLI
ncbi:MAG: hypothetical protein AAGJ28_20490, partial [Pseudomonadota bacterium]